MEIDRVCKYCHVSAYVAYDNCDPVYKKTFKFEISPGSHNSLVWDKIIKLFRKNGFKVELKSWKDFYLLFYCICLFFSCIRIPSPSRRRSLGSFWIWKSKLCTCFWRNSIYWQIFICSISWRSVYQS